MELGLVHLYWGEGKGKTTAAMGLALRALGQGARVVIVQFLKGADTGEVPLLRQLGAEIYRGKAGQKFVFQMDEAEKAATRRLQDQNLAAALARPADLLIVMLGTNDLLMEPGFRAEDAAERMENFLLALSETEAVKSGRICLWLIVPPAMKRGAWVEEDSLCLESERLGGEYRKIAEKLGIRYTDAGQWDIQVVFDGVHFSEEGHRRFAAGMLKELSD